MNYKIIKSILSVLIKSVILVFFSFNLHAAKYVRDEVKLLYVIDGDTIRVKKKNKVLSIRLIGIDTPESKKNFKSRKISKKYKIKLSKVIGYGKIASSFLKNYLKKTRVVCLEYGKERLDKYNRTLAYVFKCKNKKSINEKILKAGYAKLLTIPPNVRYYSRFKKIYKKAKKAKAGFHKSRKISKYLGFR